MKNKNNVLITEDILKNEANLVKNTYDVDTDIFKSLFFEEIDMYLSIGEVVSVLTKENTDLKVNPRFLNNRSINLIYKYYNEYAKTKENKSKIAKNKEIADRSIQLKSTLKKSIELAKERTITNKESVILVDCDNVPSSKEEVETLSSKLSVILICHTQEQEKSLISKNFQGFVKIINVNSSMKESVDCKIYSLMEICSIYSIHPIIISKDKGYRNYCLINNLNCSVFPDLNLSINNDIKTDCRGISEYSLRDIILMKKEHIIIDYTDQLYIMRCLDEYRKLLKLKEETIALLKKENEMNLLTQKKELIAKHKEEISSLNKEWQYKLYTENKNSFEKAMMVYLDNPEEVQDKDLVQESILDAI